MKLAITSFPYAVQWGEIEVPDGDNLTDDEIREYVVENWSLIKFGEPELDYEGTDFEWDEMDE